MTANTPIQLRRQQVLFSIEPRIRAVIVEVGQLMKIGQENGLIKHADDLVPALEMLENPEVFHSFYTLVAQGQLKTLIPMLPRKLQKKAKKMFAAFELVTDGGDDDDGEDGE